MLHHYRIDGNQVLFANSLKEWNDSGIVKLNELYVQEMLALTKLTKPGPKFCSRF